MEGKEQNPPGGPPQAAKGEDDQSSEEKRAMVALARILGAGPLVGGSLRLLEQLADYVQCPQEGVPREAGPAKRAAARQTTPRKRSRPRPRPRRRRQGSRIAAVTLSTSQKRE
jgi:hypothetical protein